MYGLDETVINDLPRLSPTRAFLPISPVTHKPFENTVLFWFRVVGSAYWKRGKRFGNVLVWAEKYLLAETGKKEIPGVCLYAPTKNEGLYRNGFVGVNDYSPASATDKQITSKSLVSR